MALIQILLIIYHIIQCFFINGILSKYVQNLARNDGAVMVKIMHMVIFFINIDAQNNDHPFQIFLIIKLINGVIR